MRPEAPAPRGPAARGCQSRSPESLGSEALGASAARGQGDGERDAGASQPSQNEIEGDPLARFRDGEQQAFQDLVTAFGDRLLQFFYRLCWDRGRAEDFTQELFLRLLRRAANYRPEGRLSTFIFKVATNLWIDHYRSARPQPRLHSLDQPFADGGAVSQTVDLRPDPIASAIDSEERARLRTALDALNEPHRLVVELAIYQELPYAQISEILGIPVGTVKSRMSNSVRGLKERLGMLEGGEQDSAGFRTALGGA